MSDGTAFEMTAIWVPEARIWRRLSAPIEVTEFRFEVEHARAAGVSWDASAGIRRSLAGLDGDALEQVGRLVAELRRAAGGRLP